MPAFPSPSPVSPKLTRRAALALAGFGGAAVWLGAEAASAAQLTRRGDRLFVQARVNGTAVEALLDSGAEMTLVDPRAAERLGLTLGDGETMHGTGASTMQARMVPHVALEAAGVRVADATVAVLDLTDVSRRLLGRPVEVVLGREIFDAAPLLIDIRAGVVRRLGAREPRRGVMLPLTEANGQKLMPVSIEGGAPVQADFDLGNGTGVLVGRAYARRAGLLDGRPVQTLDGGGLGGACKRERIVLKRLTLAGRTFTDVTADIDDSDKASDANIGVGLLQHFRIAADFAGGRLWLDAA